MDLVVSRVTARTLRWVSCSLFLGGIVTGAFAQTAPIITSISAPRQVVTIGQTLTLRVEASGVPAPTYQWKRSGRPVAGATASSYNVTSASPTRDSGWYQVVV